MGISNTLFKCHHKDDKCDYDDTLIVRVFGAFIERMIDRESTVWISRVMHAAGVGGPVYGRFRNGLIQKYVPGSPLTLQQTKDKHFLK